MIMVLEPDSIRSLLIRAWRERWTDVQWGIHIKTVLPRYISGDIYQLSDYLLQQALMGTLPNNLILSYLRHSLASQIVSFGGVIESISKYDGLNKPHCVQALLNLMHSMMKNVICRGKPDDCLRLASSLVAGLKWLIQVITFATDKLIDLQTAPEHSSNLNIARSILQEVLDSPFLMCMLHLGYKEDQLLVNELHKKVSDLETHLNNTSSSVIENKDLVLKTLVEMKEAKPLCILYAQAKYDSTKTPFCHAVHALITLEVIKHTTRDAKIIAHQLVLLQNFKGFTLVELYLEILRACFIGMSASEFQLYQELKWVGFTYVKVPNIFLIIHKIIHGDNSTAFSEELHEAVKRLSGMVTLLDVADFRINCNCLEYLLKEFIPRTTAPSQTTVAPSVNLLSERDAQLVLSNRLQESNFLKILPNNESPGARPGNPDLILRAQPTVISILKTLSNKTTDSVLPVLCLLISRKSRELLLVAAASSGSLHIYAQKFVKLNEQSKDVPQSPQAETSKAAVNRALVFDISFLLLCHIAQIYGTEVVVSENCETFVENWIQDNIPEPGKIKVPINPSEVAEVSLTEEFLRQINSIETDSKYAHCKWNEVCKLATMSFREVMCAAHNGQVLKQMILDLLSKFCHHLCSLPICIAAWLCSHIQQVDSDEATLALEFLQYMQTSMLLRETPSSSLEVFKDRSTLMSEIIDNMAQVLKGPGSYQKNRINGSLPSDDPLSLVNMLSDVWEEIRHSSGLLSHKALGISSDLLRLGGTKWFVASFVKSALDKAFEDELDSSIEIVYGLFHMDIVGCTLHLINHTLPIYICGRSSVDLMCEPRTSALARLTSMLLVSCWAAVQPESQMPLNLDGNATTISAPNPPLPLNKGLKRTYTQREMEAMLDNFSTHPNQEIPFNISSLGLGPEGSVFLMAVHDMFLLMTQVSKTGVLSPITHLIVYILKELVAMPHSSTIIALIPPSLLSNLVPMLSKSISFNYPQLLVAAISDPSQNGVTPFQTDLNVYANVLEKGNNSLSAAKILCVKRYFDLNV